MRIIDTQKNRCARNRFQQYAMPVQVAKRLASQSENLSREPIHNQDGHTIMEERRMNPAETRRMGSWLGRGRLPNPLFDARDQLAHRQIERVHGVLGHRVTTGQNGSLKLCQQRAVCHA